MSNYNNNNHTGGTTPSNYNSNYNGNKVEFMKGSVVLCQHGFLGHDGTMDPLFENLKNNAFRGVYGCEFCDNLLKYSELSPSNPAIREIDSLIAAHPERNIFVRTLFSNPTHGYVTTQAAQLKEMIVQIRTKHPNIPIVLVGYSKGGVVNCKCAIDNEGLIDKIINIGTPHDDTLIQDLIQILGDAMVESYGSVFGIPNIPAKLAMQAMVELLNTGVDFALNEFVTYRNLKNEWNNMSIRPKFTPIAGEAIVVNGEFNGDFVVPTESAIASGFRGRTYSDIIDNFIVRDDRVSITTSQLRNAMGNASFVLDILEAASTAITGHDVVKIVEVLYDIVSNILSNDGNLSRCLKLAHTSLLGSDDFILTHNTIGMRVLAGLNA